MSIDRRRVLWWTLPLVWIVGLSVVALRPWVDDQAAVATGDSDESALELGWHEVTPLRLPDLATSGSVLIRHRAQAPGNARPTLVNFWASTCVPCVKELPLLQRVQAAGLVDVAGVSRDFRSSSARQALRDAHVTYPNRMDPDGVYMRRLSRVVPWVAIPSSVLVVDGRVVASHIGPFTSYADLEHARDLTGRD